jgi:hypothetical protein
MENPIHTEQVGQFTIEIHPDTDPMNPRTDWDTFGTIYHTHRKYDLGVKTDDDEIQDMIDSGDYLWQYVYILDHSSVSLSTTPFNCPWDSGCVGIIAVEKYKAREEFGKRLTKQVVDKVYKYLKSEIQTFNQYLQGDVYGFIIKDKEGNVVDSCWGFYGQKYCLEQAKEALPDETYGMLENMAV